MEPAPEEHVYLAQGEQLAARKRWPEAAQAFWKASTVAPESYAARLGYTRALLNLGWLHNALAEAEASIRIQPDHADGHRLRALVLDRLFRRPESLESASRAAALAPSQPESIYVLGHCQLQFGQRDEAMTTALTLVRLAPEWPSAHELLGRVLLAKKRWREAERVYRTALALDPLSQTAVNNVGVALLRQRKYRHALRTFEQAAKMDPLDPVAKSNILKVVRPISPERFGIELLFSAIIPWRLLYVYVLLHVLLLRSAIRRRQLGIGARTYYDVEVWRGWWIRPDAILFGIDVLIVGTIGLVWYWLTMKPEGRIDPAFNALLVLSFVIAAAPTVWKVYQMAAHRKLRTR